jgi:hypothetical protein
LVPLNPVSGPTKSPTHGRACRFWQAPSFAPAGYPLRMDTIDLRPCPFCANDTLIVAPVIIEIGEVRCVKCPECSARSAVQAARWRPAMTSPGHAEFLWDQRYGSGH